MRILAIETTCDETGASVLENKTIKSNIIFSQVALHKKYSGVVPELASRAHMENISLVISEALKKAKLLPGKRRKFPRFDAVAFSRGPGLPGALLVGRVAAETMAKFCGAALIGVNHLEGHFLSPMINRKKIEDRFKYPLLGLVVSGGHTELWLSKSAGKYNLLGSTRDDAAGEAFDKVAKLINLGYPGGPVIEQWAQKGSRDLKFPRPFMEGNFEFSFSGLKTAVAYYLRDNCRRELSAREKADICFSFQNAVTDTLVYKTLFAMEKTGVYSVSAGGGVMANAFLKERLLRAVLSRGGKVYFCDKKYASDNAAMIAVAAWMRLQNGRFRSNIDIAPRLKIESWQ